MFSEEKEDLRYEPVTPNYYKFDLSDSLIQNVDYILENNGDTNLYLCCYSINNSGLYPFIQYYLFKNYDNTLSFVNINNSHYRMIPNLDTEKIISYCQSYLFSLFEDNGIKKENEFKGFYYDKKEIYLFFDFTNCDLNINDIYKKSNMWLTVSTEILESYVLDMPINKNVFNFFLNNLHFLYLLDINNNQYEIPDVWFVGKEEHSLNFTYVFGVSNDLSGIVGPYYYFTSYKNALIQGSWSKNNEETKFGKLVTSKNGKYLKGGIVRFAIFSGKCLMKLNKINDIIDNSETKHIKLEESIDNKYEKMTMRLSDYDGLWTNNYDSVYIGNVELDNGDKFDEGPLLAIKNYERQIPLSYHYINNKHISDKCDKEQYYSIQ